jgi:BirA family biotin operon repressor/biotin-[acetyl-CoA-carboxylase] ligase
MNLRNIPLDWVVYYHKTGSTMADAKSLIQSINPPPDRFLVLAEEQSAAIGRNQNRWFSPTGGLYFSHCYQAAETPSGITLLIGLVLFQTILDHFPSLQNGLKLKWPNDLLYDEQKLAGILVETYQGYLIAGIGINTNSDLLPSQTGFQAISLKKVFCFEISNYALLNNFSTRLSEVLLIFNTDGLTDFISEINANLYGKGREIIFDDGKEPINGMLTGISANGALILTDRSGVPKHYYSGSIISTFN